MYLDGDFGKIEISILSRTSSDDYWDGNWLYSKVTVKVGFFNATYNCNLRTDEFALFHESIERLVTDKETSAQFSPMEGGLLLSFAKNESGNFILKGIAKSDEHYEVSLLFEIFVDYVQLEKLKNSVYDLLKKFPVKGSPS